MVDFKLWTKFCTVSNYDYLFALQFLFVFSFTLLTLILCRVHGTKVAEVPLIAMYSPCRRQGMCCHLMSAIEEVLIYSYCLMVNVCSICYSNYFFRFILFPLEPWGSGKHVVTVNLFFPLLLSCTFYMGEQNAKYHIFLSLTC